MKQMTISIGKATVTLKSDDDDFINKAGGIFSSISAAAMSALNDEDFKADVSGISIIVSDKSDKKFENTNDSTFKPNSVESDEKIWL